MGLRLALSQTQKMGLILIWFICPCIFRRTKLLLLILFANSLDPDQAPHFVGSDLDPNCFDTDDCVPDFFLK